MKNLFKNLMLVAVAAMGFTACEQVIDDVNATNETFTVNIVGEFADDTRSGFDGKNDAGTGYKSAWDGEETVRFAIIPDTFADTAKATYVDEENESEGNRATFAPTFDSNEGTIHAFSPKGVYVKDDASACKGGFTSDAITLKYNNAYVVVPAEQTPLANSVDPAAHILAGKADFAENVNMTFNHVVAYGKMTIKNFAGDIDKVEITASESLAGISCKYYYNEGELNNANVKTITLNPKNVVDNVFWFGCAPADLSNGTLTVKVYSGDDTYTKELNITGKTDENGEKIEFKFQQGRVASFVVNMAGVEADVKEEVVDPTTLTYKLVTDASTLAVGDKVIIVAKDSDVAMSTAQNTNNRGVVAVTKSDNTIADVDGLQILTLEAGKTSGTFAFNTGSGYLYAASSSKNYLRTENTLSANSSWSITIADGIATIKAQGTNSRNWMRFNSSNNPQIFSCYGSGQADVSIYKQAKVVGGDIELADPLFELDVDELSFNAAGESKVVNVLPLNNFEAEVTATPNVEWLSIENDGYKYTVTAAENDAAERTATITFSADGYEDVVVDVKQNTSIVESVTVAEFLAADEDATLYRLRGTITGLYGNETSAKSYGNFYLYDGTDTVIIYGLLTPDGEKQKQWTDAEIKVGDDIEVITVRASYNGNAQGKDAIYVNHVSPGTRAFWSFDKDSVSFGYEGGEEEIKVDAYNLTENVECVFEDGDLFEAEYKNGVLTIRAEANPATEDLNATLYVRSSGLEQIITISQAAYVEPGEVVTATESVDFSAQSYTNGVAIDKYEGGNFSIAFNKGSNSNAPKYYTSGAAIRCYGGNYFTITSDKTIVTIELTYGSSDGTNTISTDVGTFVSPKWTGESESVKFTIGGSKGNRRIQGITVTYVK